MESTTLPLDEADPTLRSGNTSQNDKIEINPDGSSATVSFEHLELDIQHPVSDEVLVLVEKRPRELVEGESYLYGDVLLATDSEKMAALADRAQLLKELPEHERARPLLELLRSELNYAHSDEIEALSETDPERAQWISVNSGVSATADNVPLSDVFEAGFGVCRELSVGYLWLAQQAGLRGVLSNSRYGTIQNIQRTDTDEPLFKSVDVGEPPNDHVWVELQMSDGTWLPVDPSVRLVGDNEEELRMFQDAHYQCFVAASLDASSDNRALYAQPKLGATIRAGEAQAEIAYHLELARISTMVLGGDEIAPTYEPYKGPAVMLLEIEDRNSAVHIGIIGATRVQQLSEVAEVVVGIMVDGDGVIDLSDEATRVEAGGIVHDAWLSRNEWAKGGELDVPFDQLIPEEQAKDISQIEVAQQIFSPEQ